MMNFHFTTLEEYYIGTLKLPVGNAVSDGSVLVVLLFLVSGIIGNEVWAKQLMPAKYFGISEESAEYLSAG